MVMNDLHKILSTALNLGDMTEESRREALRILAELEVKNVERFNIEAEKHENIFIAIDRVEGNFLTFTSPMGNISGKILKESETGYIVAYGADLLYVSKSLESNILPYEIDQLDLTETKKNGPQE
jgi:hypothetical protein